MVDRAPSVLVVEDEEPVILALCALLQGRGFSVRAARNGEEALKIAAELPDVVLLDLTLPGIDGVEICRRLRTWSQVPILVLSARTDERQKVQALEAGADDYVTKPFGTEELLARIRAALRRGQMHRDLQPILRARGLEVHLLTRDVIVDGQEVRLTPTEYELLRELAANPDRVLTHRHLLEFAMGPGYEDDVADLRTFIWQIRQKVEKDPRRPQLIVTMPGIGYRFCPDPA